MSPASDYIEDHLTKFTQRWGIEPAGILMHKLAFEHLRSENSLDNPDEMLRSSNPMYTFKGLKIYISAESKILEIRFVL